MKPQITVAKEPRSRRRSFIPVALNLLALAALFGCARDKTAPESTARVDGETITFATNASQLTSLTLHTAEPRRLAVTRLTGRLFWSDDATVRVFTPVAGRVNDVLVRPGQIISAGDPLAEIDSPDFGQALADTRAAEANLRLADKTLTRARELLEHGAAAQKDVENAEAAYASAVAERDRTAARLALYGGNAKGTNEMYLLRSPLGGALVEKNINPGQEVRPDQMLANAPNLFAPLFVVSDPAKLWVQLDISELDLPSLRVNQPLRIYSRAYTTNIFDGVLDNIGDSLDPATRTVKVRGTVNNSDKLLKAEMYVTVDVVMDAAQTAQAGVEIPAKAVFVRDNRSYLFVEESPGRYQRQQVKLGPEQDGMVPVFDGLRAGQKVVTDGCLLLEALVESSDKS